MRRRLEICVDDFAGIDAAVEGGADRIELCSALALGGLTPSAGLMSAAAASGLPVMAMIRPRAGGFDWTAEECAAMEAEIAATRDAGLTGVVIGATRGSGRDRALDLDTLARLVRAAEGMQITLHRCIDILGDPLAAVDQAADLGIGRILTSGAAPKAMQGLDMLLQMRQRAAGRLIVMPGGGVTPEILSDILAAVEPAEVHASASVPQPEEPDLAALGFQPPGARRTHAATVARLKALLDAAGPADP